MLVGPVNMTAHDEGGVGAFVKGVISPQAWSNGLWAVGLLTDERLVEGVCVGEVNASDGKWVKRPLQHHFILAGNWGDLTAFDFFSLNTRGYHYLTHKTYFSKLTKSVRKLVVVANGKSKLLTN